MRLDALANELTAGGSQPESVRVTAHADHVGGAYNQRLSERRAQAVRNDLIAKDVAPSRGAGDPLVQCHERSHAALVACLAPSRRMAVDVVTQRQ